jgi:hypothetical protein
MDKLYNTGLDKVYSNVALNAIFHTKGDSYLQSQDVPVMKRKFNALPSDKLPPFRALTDHKAVPIVEYRNVGVVSDFPKSMAGDIKHTLWKDGTYDDMKKMAARSTDEYNPRLEFAPDTDFDMRFNRLEREKSVQFNIDNYFSEKQMEKELERRIFLTEYGLTPEEVEKAIAEKRVKDAVAMLEKPKTSLLSSSRRVEGLIKAMAAQRQPQSIGNMDARPTERTMAAETQQTGTTVRARGRTAGPRMEITMPTFKIGDTDFTKLKADEAKLVLSEFGVVPPSNATSAILREMAINTVKGRTPTPMTAKQIDEIREDRLGKAILRSELILRGAIPKASTDFTSLKEALKSINRR